MLRIPLTRHGLRRATLPHEGGEGFGLYLFAEDFLLSHCILPGD